MFSEDFDELLLIKKVKPSFQKGKLNGVGGKIEQRDASPEAAMTREFLEETGIEHNDWKKVCVLEGKENVDPWMIHVYVSSSADVANAQTMSEEEVIVTKIDDLEMKNTVSNLMWLIPMALSVMHDHFDNKANPMTYHVKQV